MLEKAGQKIKELGSSVFPAGTIAEKEDAALRARGFAAGPSGTTQPLEMADPPSSVGKTA